MTKQQALETLKGKTDLDRTEAARVLATEIDPNVRGSEREAIIRHLETWTPGDSETVASIKSDFKAWKREHGTYEVAA